VSTEKKEWMMGQVDDIIPVINPRYSDEKGKAAPIWEHKFVYDTNISTVEPLYFWIIDYMSDAIGGVEKISDSFTATPGSAYFADLGQRATRMQEEGMKIMATLNAVVKSVVNLVYDLRNFDLRLKAYEKLHSKKPGESQEGMLSLKEIWMNSVDAQRGMGSINNMAHQYGFSTLRPAFMAADSVKKVGEMDINDIVKRVLESRVSEFLSWVELSEAELKKRYEIEKAYLRNQIDTMKLYSSWVGPYLQAAEQLRMKGSKDAGLVSAFNSMILELELLGMKDVKVADEVTAKNLPEQFAKKDRNGEIRKFKMCMTVNFKFRSYSTQQFPHAGRVEIEFRAYVLNSDELLLLKKKRDDGMKESMLKLAQNLTEVSLKTLQEDIDYFTKKKEEEKEEKTFFEGIYHEFKKSIVGQSRVEKEKEAEEAEKEKKEKEEKKMEKLKAEGVPEDTHEESVVRQFAEVGSAEMCFSLFDIFKKSQGMAAFPKPFDEPDVVNRIRARMAEVNNLLKNQPKK